MSKIKCLRVGGRGSPVLRARALFWWPIVPLQADTEVMFGIGFPKLLFDSDSEPFDLARR